jgi:hypothetical protein
VIHTVQESGITPDYLTDIFARMPQILKDDPEADLTEFLPWVWKPKNPEA